MHCGLLQTGMITLDPPYGSMLGGAGVIVSGDGLSVVEEDEITCIFDGIRVIGIYVNDVQVLCIAPMLERTGRLEFQLSVTGRNSFSGDSFFTSCKFLI